MSGHDASLRIFSYLPNPRLAKATIAARLCGVKLEVRGAAPRELAQWLWDFDARPLAAGDASAATSRTAHTGFGGTLHKTDAFLAAHPFGTVPAAWSGDGEVGIFESNSIARAVARLGAAKRPLYGGDLFEASRIDSFLDASLVFARDAQLHLLALASGKPDPATHARARAALDAWLGGIDRALAPAREHLVGDSLSLADIAFAAELALFSGECVNQRLLDDAGLARLWDPSPLGARFPRAIAHFARLCEHDAFAPDLGPYLAKLEAR
ncbi:MAG TPA: glutathione S-transferase family protein [Myxococcota bacterium]|nr:glutathione S-transferase family protein [Myxococcota bacterium]